MLKTLRRNSKQLLESRRKSVASIPPPLSEDSRLKADDTTTTSQRTLTFFDLPAEIRNVIYEHIARNTSVFVPVVSKKSAKLPPPPIPSLLLTSTGTRREFRPLLLEISPVTIIIKDYDFINLTRIISSLYNSERLALRLNPQITIRLQIEKVNKESIDHLRRWLTSRADGLDRIPFQYNVIWGKHRQIIPTSTQVHRINVYIQRRTDLNHNMEALAQLHMNVGEMMRFELAPIIRALEDEMRNVSTVNVCQTSTYKLLWNTITNGAV